jgi:hypothetical protein
MNAPTFLSMKECDHMRDGIAMVCVQHVLGWAMAAGKTGTIYVTDKRSAV